MGEIEESLLDSLPAISRVFPPVPSIIDCPKAENLLDEKYIAYTRSLSELYLVSDKPTVLAEVEKLEGMI